MAYMTISGDYGTIFYASAEHFWTSALALSGKCECSEIIVLYLQGATAKNEAQEEDDGRIKLVKIYAMLCVDLSIK